MKHYLIKAAGAAGMAVVVAAALCTGTANSKTTDISTPDSPAATFQNPLFEKRGPDPWAIYHDGNYY